MKIKRYWQTGYLLHLMAFFSLLDVPGLSTPDKDVELQLEKGKV